MISLMGNDCSKREQSFFEFNFTNFTIKILKMEHTR